MIEHTVRANGDHILHRCHDLLDLLIVQLKNTIENADLVVAQGLLAMTVEGQETLELCFLVSMCLIMSQYVVEELGNRPRDGSYEMG